MIRLKAGLVTFRELLLGYLKYIIIKISIVFNFNGQCKDFHRGIFSMGMNVKITSPK